MPNLRLVWPTNEELRERHALMDQMMERKGSICLRQSASMAGWPLSRRVPSAATGHAGFCRRWLQSEGQRGTADFCPNVAFFRSCRSIES